jgi:predicted permease
VRPDHRDLDDELRGHLELAIKERLERGASPEAARLAALRELGYVPAVREEMRRVWYGRWFDAATALLQDMRVGLRSLRRAKGLAATVVVTLALGIGANAAIFSVVRGVLLRPLVNRDEDRLIYVRQSAPGIGAANMTFSVPEIEELEARVTAVSAFGDFSTIDFSMIGLGDPRVVHAGVVSGTFFEVMGLRPHLGRLITRADDGPEAAGVAVLTHRFWTAALAADPTVIGRTIRLDTRTATIIGVLEPSVPYPADTEIIANVVTSPHHLGAVMVTDRTHRMTELFGRLAPDATLDGARAQIATAHAAMMAEHPEAYARAQVQVQTARLRDAITTPARTILWLLAATAALVFVIAGSNVANLLLARSVRREGELAVRAALGASRGALRRTLLAESLLLSGTGAALGLLLAGPLVAIVSRFAARFSVRALEVTLDPTVPWLGAGLALATALMLAFVPRLPVGHAATIAGVAAGGLRLTPGTNRRLKAFAAAQVALTFLLLSAAGTLLASLLTLQQARTGYDLASVVAFDVPLPIESVGPKTLTFVDEALRRIAELPGVERAAAANAVPWRDAGRFGPFPFTAEGYTPADGEPPPMAVIRNVTPGFFATVGVAVVAGRDFTADDSRPRDPVAIISRGLAERLFPGGDALNRRVQWSGQSLGGRPMRIVGVVEDVVDDGRGAQATPAIYHPLRQVPFAGRLFVRTGGQVEGIVGAVGRVIREIAADQPVERATTLEAIRAEVLTPDRLNAVVVGGFAAVALLIAVVGVAGVLAFTVSTRTREFGVRLAVGSTPGHLLTRVLGEGVALVAAGIVVGSAAGVALTRVAASVIGGLSWAGPWPMAGAAALLTVAATVAALLPAAKAARVDAMQALRTE